MYLSTVHHFSLFIISRQCDLIILCPVPPQTTSPHPIPFHPITSCPLKDCGDGDDDTASSLSTNEFEGGDGVWMKLWLEAEILKIFYSTETDRQTES